MNAGRRSVSGSRRLSPRSAGEAGLLEQIGQALYRHPAVGSVELTGSRARGDAGPLSDWDFAVHTSDFRAVAEALPALVAPLEPLAQQWDRLSPRACYMLMLPGAIKVDLIFDATRQSEPPWAVTAETLKGIDDHFWDWMIWLGAKDAAGKRDLVAAELRKMHDHLLAPLGAPAAFDSIEKAVHEYLAAREKAEARFAREVPRSVEREVRARLARHGYAV